MRRLSAMARVAVSTMCVGLLATVSPVAVEAGKAVPYVYISNCQISKSGGAYGGGSVTASGGWSGIRAGAIVDVQIVVWQVANPDESRLGYSGNAYMTLNTQTRTSGFLDASSSSVFAYDGSPSWLQAGYATAQIRINRPRDAQNASDLLSCTVVE